MVLSPVFLGGVWFIIHRYSVFHTFIWRGQVGGLSQMKLTSFEKKLSHFEMIPQTSIHRILFYSGLGLDRYHCCFIQDSFYSGFSLSRIPFIQGSVYPGFCLIQGLAQTSFTVYIYFCQFYTYHLIRMYYCKYNQF